VYVVREGRRFTSRADAVFLGEAVDALWARLARSNWDSEEDREFFRLGVEKARQVYAQIVERSK
jgi:hypothetical protein